MSEKSHGAGAGATGGTDAAGVSRQIADIAETSRRLVAEFLDRQAAGQNIGMADPLAIGAAFFEMTARMMSRPGRLVQAQLALWQDYMSLWQRTAAALARRRAGAGGRARRRATGAFATPAWSDNALFDFIKQSYLLTARWMQGDGARMSTASTSTPRARSISIRGNSSMRWRRRISC